MESMIFVIVLVYIIASAFLSLEGGEREIGWIKSLLNCIFFTPIIGLLVILSSKRKKDVEFEEKILEILQKQSDVLEQIKNQTN